jgi:hypothetical protein
MSMHTPTIEIPCHYEVVGEHVSDPTHLLVIGDDGRFYDLDLLNGKVEPTEYSDAWVIDSCSVSDKLEKLRPMLFN